MVLFIISLVGSILEGVGGGGWEGIGGVVLSFCLFVFRCRIFTWSFRFMGVFGLGFIVCLALWSICSWLIFMVFFVG